MDLVPQVLLSEFELLVRSDVIHLTDNEGTRILEYIKFRSVKRRQLRFIKTSVYQTLYRVSSEIEYRFKCSLL